MGNVTELTTPLPPVRPLAVLIDPAELTRLREVERHAALLATAVYNRRARGWRRVPMRQVDSLAAVLLGGRA
jgi:hypothetical protein